MTLVLASSSPRRLALLEDGGVEVVVRPADVDESARTGEGPVAMVRRLAAAKADAVVGEVGGATVLAADTVVALADDVLGKPTDAADARAMLQAQSGRTVSVWTGVAVRGHAHPPATVVVGTLLRMRVLDDDEVAAYLATGEPFGVAGGFRIQGRGGALVADRNGCWTNVVGLPTCVAAQLLAPHGVELRDDGCRPVGPDGSGAHH